MTVGPDGFIEISFCETLWKFGLYGVRFFSSKQCGVVLFIETFAGLGFSCGKSLPLGGVAGLLL